MRSAWAARASALERLTSATARIGAAIHSVRAVDPASAEVVGAWAAERDVPLHCHVSEQPAENEQCIAAYGITPVGLLDRHGAARRALHRRPRDPPHRHATSTLLGASGTTVCLCPTTERDLADGIGPARALRDAGSDARPRLRLACRDRPVRRGASGRAPRAVGEPRARQPRRSELLRAGDRQRPRQPRLARGRATRGRRARRPVHGAARLGAAGRRPPRAPARVGRVRGHRGRRRPRRRRRRGGRPRRSARAHRRRRRAGRRRGGRCDDDRASTTSACSSRTTTPAIGGDGALGILTDAARRVRRSGDRRRRHRPAPGRRPADRRRGAVRDPRLRRQPHAPRVRRRPVGGVRIADGRRPVRGGRDQRDGRPPPGRRRTPRCGHSPRRGATRRAGPGSRRSRSSRATASPRPTRRGACGSPASSPATRRSSVRTSCRPSSPDRADDYVDYVCGEMLPACAPHAALDRRVLRDRRVRRRSVPRRARRRPRPPGSGCGSTPTSWDRARASPSPSRWGAPRPITAHTSPTPTSTRWRADRPWRRSCRRPTSRPASRTPTPAACIDAGAVVAIATNCNPGSSYTTSMSFCIALAVRDMHMTPEEAVAAATVGGARGPPARRCRPDRARVPRRPRHPRRAELHPSRVPAGRAADRHHHRGRRGGLAGLTGLSPPWDGSSRTRTERRSSRVW